MGVDSRILTLEKNLENLAKDEHGGQPLVCTGCAHGGVDIEFPGGPSGERPCCFCLRRDLWKETKIKEWYDGGSLVKFPMDCYHSLDMKRQFEKWMKEAEESRDFMEELKKL